MKKGIALLLIVLFILTLLPAPFAMASPEDLFDFAPVPDGSAMVLIKYKGSGKKVRIPDTFEGLPVTSIGEKAFYQCGFLESVKLPEELRAIGAQAFGGCKAMAKIDLPNTLETIGRMAFAGCSKLETIRIPAMVSAIGEAPFWSCKNLVAIETDEENAVYESVDGVLFSKAMKALITYPQKKPGKSYGVPEGTELIGMYAFGSCMQLQGVTFPQSLKEIAGAAFLGCENLREAPLPQGLKSIGGNAFSWCRRLKEVNIPLSVVSISDAFLNCDSLTEFLVEDGNPRYASFDGALYDTQALQLVAWPNGSQVNNCTLPEWTQSIGWMAFMNSVNLESITLPNGLVNIGPEAFRNCEGLKKLAVPKSVNSIGKDAFTVWNGEIILQGKEGSYVQRYAAENALTFEVIP